MIFQTKNDRPLKGFEWFALLGVTIFFNSAPLAIIITGYFPVNERVITYSAAAAAIFSFFISIILYMHPYKRGIPTKLRFVEFVYVFIFLTLLFYAFSTYLVIGDYKLEGFISLIELLIIVCVFFISYKLPVESIDYFLNTTYIVCFLYTIYLVFDPAGLMYTVDLNYLRVTWFLPVLFIIVYVKIFERDNIIFNSLLAITILYLLLNYLGRFPVVFVLLVIFVYPCIKYKSKVMIIIMPALFVLLYNFNYIFNYTTSLINKTPVFKRISILVYDPEGTLRYWYLEQFIDKIGDFIFVGYGVRCSGQRLYDSPRDYPHNILLELVSDYGVIGLIVSIMLFVLVLRICYLYLLTKHKTSVLTMIVFICAYFFFAFMKSGTIYDAYPLFISLGLAASMARSRKVIQSYGFKNAEGIKRLQYVV